MIVIQIKGAWFHLKWQGCYVFALVRLSVCLSVCRITEIVANEFVEICWKMGRSTNNLVRFWWRYGSRCEKQECLNAIALAIEVILRLTPQIMITVLGALWAALANVCCVRATATCISQQNPAVSHGSERQAQTGEGDDGDPADSADISWWWKPVSRDSRVDVKAIRNWERIYCNAALLCSSSDKRIRLQLLSNLILTTMWNNTPASIFGNYQWLILIKMWIDFCASSDGKNYWQARVGVYS